MQTGKVTFPSVTWNKAFSAQLPRLDIDNQGKSTESRVDHALRQV